MKHLWINIDKNLKRKNFMEKQFNNSNSDNIRISAITPEMFDDVLEHKRPLSCKHPGCTSCEYEFACLSSHIKAMNECLKYEDEYFVIMEDDIYIPFEIDYDELLKNINKEIDIVQMMVLYDTTVKNLDIHYNITSTNFIKWQYLLPSTGMYIVSKKGAKKLVNMFINKNNKYDFSSSEYQIVADVLLYSSANTICSTLPYCYPYIEMGSEIHPDHLKAHLKAINEIKKVITNKKNYPFIKKKFELI
tara:strand:- start:3592 stop:4332 length:741 start_codon:yes stop_codon:yes gene_type:complete